VRLGRPADWSWQVLSDAKLCLNGSSGAEGGLAVRRSIVIQDI
jgi:hypothetical protein